MKIDGYQCYTESFFSGLEPDPVLDLDEWQDSNIILSVKGAAEPGPYRTDRAPFLREIAKCLSPSSPFQKIVWMKSAQVGASQLGFNWIGFVADNYPGPIMMVQPTDGLAEKVSKQRISPLFEETPALKKLSSSKKAKDSSDTIALKEYNNGSVLALIGANSPVGLSSMPIRYLFLDEVDRYPRDVGGEGSPVELAAKRTTTYSSKKKIFISSTPTEAETSIVEAEFKTSDQRRYFVPCPLENCGAYQYLKWNNVVWENDDPKTVKYKCEHCQQLFEERHKTWMLAKGEWIATAKGDGTTAGFHINSLYSPVGWKSWVELVDEFLKCKGDAPKLKTFVNTSLGESWKEDYSNKMDASAIESRGENYKLGVAPANVFVITAGVDCQDDRFEVSFWGWGKDEECWMINHQIILGDPNQSEIWKVLEESLVKAIPHETAEPLKPEVVFMDSGGSYTQYVYQFCREHRNKNWFAIKGSSQRGKPAISRPSKVDINFKGKILKSGCQLFSLGTDTIKSVIMGRLKHNNVGPGYIHFTQELNSEYFKQITSERQVTKYVRGYPIREWVKNQSERNEALDCFVYAYAALKLVLSRHNPRMAWEILEKKLLIRKPTSSDIPTTERQKPPSRKIMNQGKNFINSW